MSGVKYSKDASEVSGCADGVRTLTFPRSVRIIHQKAFHKRKQLHAVVFNEGLEVLGAAEYKPDGGMGTGAFEASGVRRVRLPSTLKRIEYSAFEDCKDLRGVELPDGLEYLGKRCFCGSGLESVVLPPSVRAVGPHAFAECTQLRSASLNEGLETLGANEHVRSKNVSGSSFAKSGLESVLIPSTLKVIEDTTFARCKDLRRVQF